MSAQKLTALVRNLPKRAETSTRISGALSETHLVRRAANLPLPVAKRSSGYQPATAVGGYLPKLTKKAFEKYGFSTTTLVMEWAAIAGVDIANATLPEKLKWPRATAGDGETEQQSYEGAVLVLRVDPARALNISYRERQIVDRINAHFGYRAVASLRIVQAPLDKPATTPLQPQPSARPAASPSTGDPLSDALGRLGAGLKRGASKPFV